MKKTFVTVTGIRPDFIRMSAIFKKLDQEFNHIMIHTGQHFDNLLSDVFFKNLNLRAPNYNLKVGGIGKEHFHQTAEASIKLVELLRTIPNVDGVIFLGDSNSVVTSIALKKEGYKIIHIEAGMRSGDKRMLEEINRTVCDCVSDILFVYHENYKKHLLREGISDDKIHVIGNTIVEVINNMELPKNEPRQILIDIHRPENFKYRHRLENLLEYIRIYKQKYNCECLFLNFPRTVQYLKEFNLYDEYNSVCSCIPLLSFNDYIEAVSKCHFIISDSGTAQEEPALLNIPVIVPRDYTERPESVTNYCSLMFSLEDKPQKSNTDNIDLFLTNYNYKKDSTWLGNGTTSNQIIDILKII
jgi:UDP-N-acetylglucosamine 2-epimerase (non-hydrolysing)